MGRFSQSKSNTSYKKRLIFLSLNHQSDQQFEQKYENKREKSRVKVENSLEFMLSQCCESSLTRVEFFNSLCAKNSDFLRICLPLALVYYLFTSQCGLCTSQIEVQPMKPCKIPRGIVLISLNVPMEVVKL